MMDTVIAEAEESRPSGAWEYISPSRLNLWMRCSRLEVDRVCCYSAQWQSTACGLMRISN